MRTIIVGAGPAGLAAAWWLRRAGRECLLIEHRPSALPISLSEGAARGVLPGGYVIDFFGPGYDTVERMGLSAQLHERALDLRGVQLRAPGGRPTARLDVDPVRHAIDGRLVSLLRGDLEAVLRDALDEGVEIRQGLSVRHVEQDASEVRVELTDGTVESGDLLVGADGLHSRVRELVFGPEEHYRRPLGAHTAAFLFEDPELVADLGHDLHMVEALGVQAGLYRLSESVGATFLTHKEAGPAPTRDLPGHLRRIYDRMGWHLPRAMAACPDRPFYDAVEQILVPNWFRGRTVLIGDSCQAVSLMAGQGASMAVSAAEVLGRELTEVSGNGLPAALERYEQRLKPAVVAKQRRGRRFASWFLPSSATQLVMRRSLFRAASSPLTARLARPFLTPSRSRDRPRRRTFSSPGTSSRRRPCGTTGTFASSHKGKLGTRSTGESCSAHPPPTIHPPVCHGFPWP